MPGGLPPNIDFAFSVGQPIEFPYGDFTGGLHTWADSNMGSFGFSGGVSHDDRNLHCVLLGYLAQIWQRTAAKEFVGSKVLKEPAAGFRRWDLGGDEIRIAQLFPDTSKHQVSMFGGALGPLDFGYYRWIYDDYAGPMHRFGFPGHCALPEYPGANAIEIEPKDPTWVCGIELGGFGTQAQNVSFAGKPVDPQANDFSGVTAESGSAAFTVVSGTDIIGLPARRANQVIVNESVPQEWDFDFITTRGSGPMTLALLAYAAEIWQKTCVPQSFDILTDGSVLPGGVEINPTEGFVKRVFLEIENDGKNSGTKFGFGNAGYYGAWSAIGNMGWTDLKYINSLQTLLIPDVQPCFGVWIFLKSGCTGATTTWSTKRISHGLTTPNGDVCFTDDVVDGLSWFP